METISFEDFMKVDIRVGTIVQAEEVPKSKKLLKLQVNFGDEIGVRTIMAGIAKDYYSPSPVGYKVVAVVNLAPRAIMGVESHGMLLAVYGSAGLHMDSEGHKTSFMLEQLPERVWLVTPGPVPNGTKVG